ncbi:hypothetical protein Bca4012_025787 [Brassica carinata]
MARLSVFFAASAIFLPRLPSAPLTIYLSHFFSPMAAEKLRLRGTARRVSEALRGDGTVHGAIHHRRHSNRGSYGARAKYPLNRVQERDRISKHCMEDHILNGAQKIKSFRVSLVTVITHLRYF